MSIFPNENKDVALLFYRTDFFLKYIPANMPDLIDFVHGEIASFYLGKSHTSDRCLAIAGRSFYESTGF
jgi:hypothetical protein